MFVFSAPHPGRVKTKGHDAKSHNSQKLEKKTKKKDSPKIKNMRRPLSPPHAKIYGAVLPQVIKNKK